MLDQVEPSRWRRNALLLLLMIGSLGGCSDQGDQTSKESGRQAAHQLSSIPEVPTAPDFDYATLVEYPVEDPPQEDAGLPPPEAVDGRLVALIGGWRALPPPTYQQINTYAQVGALEGHRGGILGMELVGAPPLVVTHGNDATIRLWSPERSDATKTIKDTFAGRLLASSDGRILLAEIQGSTKIIDASSGAVVGQLPRSGLMAISHDGTRVLAQRSSNLIDVIDLATGERLLELRGHKHVQCARFSPDDRQIVTGGDATDQTVRIWDSSSGSLIARLQDPRMSEAISIAISPNGRLIAAVERMKITIWDVESQKIFRQIEDSPSSGGAYSMASFMDGDGRRLVIGKGKHLVILDLTTGNIIQTLKAHDTSIDLLAVSRDGACIVTGTTSTGGEPLKVWGRAGDVPASAMNAAIPEPLKVVLVASINEQRGGVGPLSASPDGGVIYTGTSNSAFDGIPGGMVNAYDPRSGQLLRSFDSKIPRRVSHATSLALSADGRLLAMGTSSGDIVVWEASSAREIASSEAYSREIMGLTFLQDGGLLVLVSTEQILPVLAPTTGQEVRRLTVPGASLRGLRALRDGSGVIIGDTLFRADDGQMIRRFDNVAMVALTGLAASADGGVFAGVPRGGTEVRVWSTGRDSPSASRRVGEAGSIRVLRVSSGGSYVASVHIEGFTNVLTIRDAASLVEVAKFGLDRFASVADIIVDEQSRTVTVSGTAQDGIVRFFKW